MKFLFILVCCIYFVQTIKETPSSCDYISSVNQVSTLKECQAVIPSSDKQCCIAVLSLMGNNQFFCQEFNKNADQSEIDSVMKEDFLDRYSKLYFGAIVKAQASCSQDVKPFEGNKCSIEDTQKTNQFGNCTTFEKNKDSDYCCLFSGNVGHQDGKNTPVHFCNELDQSQTKDMIDISGKIENNTGMNNVKYISCSPSIPDPDDEGEKASSKYISNLSSFFLVSLMLLVF